MFTNKFFRRTFLFFTLVALPLTVFSDEIDAVVKSINSRKDDVNDLIATILDVSPVARKKAAKLSSAGRSRKSEGGALVPNLGIPQSQLLEASAKFPKDFVGKYVYGRVSFKSFTVEGDDACIMFTAAGYRGFRFYTKDPNLIRMFSQLSWGTKFMIPKECPLKILTKDLTFYVVRLPWDQDRTEHSFKELFRDFGKDMQGIVDETKQRVMDDLQGIQSN